MIENDRQLQASLEYAQKWTRILEGLRIAAESSPEKQTSDLMAFHMTGPLSEVSRVLEEALEFLEAGRSEVRIDKAGRCPPKHLGGQKVRGLLTEPFFDAVDGRVSV